MAAKDNLSHEALPSSRDLADDEAGNNEEDIDTRIDQALNGVGDGDQTRGRRNGQ
jgi:hypothetical protein